MKSRYTIHIRESKIYGVEVRIVPIFGVVGGLWSIHISTDLDRLCCRRLATGIPPSLWISPRILLLFMAAILEPRCGVAWNRLNAALFVIEPTVRLLWPDDGVDEPWDVEVALLFPPTPRFSVINRFTRLFIYFHK